MQFACAIPHAVLVISVLSPCAVVCSAFSCSCFPGVQASGVRRFFFFIFRTFEPSAFAGFCGSSCCIFRAFGVSGCRFSWVSGFWPSGFRVFDAGFPDCKLSGVLPFTFSSFRLSFFDLSPELSIVCSKFAFVRCVSLLFAVSLFCCFFFFSGNSKQPFLPVQQPLLPVQQPFFPMPTTIFEIAPFMFAFVDVCLSRDVLISQIRPRNPKLKRLLGCLCVGTCLEVLARLRA